MDIGIHKNISFKDYTEIPAVNNSLLSKFSQSPAHAKAYMTCKTEDTDSMLLGHVFHSRVLEPLDDAYAIEPICDKRTKAGKGLSKLFKQANSDKIIITQDVSDTADIMASKVLTHSIAKEFLIGDSELTIIWEINGVLCKARIDKKQDGIICDLKSTRNANDYSFKGSFYKYNYHTQSAMYLDGIKSITGEDCSYVIIAQESDIPYGTNVFEIEQGVIELGRQEYLKNLETYQQCVAFDSWPCYPETLNKITL